MSDAREGPQVTLITPPEVDLLDFPDRLAACLDAVPVACLRIALATRDDARLGRTVDALREVAHARDVAVVLQGPADLAQRLGLDGVHLPDGARQVRAARKALGQDAIVGAFCNASRHEGMTAGELGADYVSFGPWGSLERELLAWWSETIEVPVIAEGGLAAAVVRDLAPVTDFFAFGPEIWDAEDPVERLRGFAAAMT